MFFLVPCIARAPTCTARVCPFAASQNVGGVRVWGGLSPSDINPLTLTSSFVFFSIIRMYPQYIRYISGICRGVTVQDYVGNFEKLRVFIVFPGRTKSAHP